MFTIYSETACVAKIKITVFVGSYNGVGNRHNATLLELRGEVRLSSIPQLDDSSLDRLLPLRHCLHRSRIWRRQVYEQARQVRFTQATHMLEQSPCHVQYPWNDSHVARAL